MDVRSDNSADRDLTLTRPFASDMANDTDYELWCLIEGDKEPFPIVTSSTTSIGRLKELIYEKCRSSPLQARDLILKKDNADFNTYKNDIHAGEYRPNTDDKIDDPWRQIAQVWSSPPLNGYLHIFVSPPTGHTLRVPKHKKEFEAFHTSNGVRTITGTIGPVQNVRMLLKNGYRHVYMSRKFAMRHGFIPQDAAPGHYGYSGLVNIGKLPITIGRTKTTHVVYLSEESHFDVVLGRSFMEKRQIKTNPIDPTDIVCLDTGEKLDCELVILKDGKGEIVTVT